MLAVLVCETMALALESDLPTVIGEVARGHGYDVRLREEQLSAIEKFASGQDVFVSLPKGFGKSLIYGLLPTAFDRLKGPTPMALIVSPLAHSVLHLRSPRSASVLRLFTNDVLQY